MSIEKKSLISTLKTTKKANVAKEDFASVKSPFRMATKKGLSPAKMATKKGLSPAKMATKKM